MRDKEYDAIIIGAGCAGLTCGLKLSSMGRKVLVVEKQPVPGGFATSFKRKGFTFESSVHCVNDLGEGGEIRRLLEEFGLDKEVDFIKLKDFARVIYPEHDFVADFSRDNFVNYLKNTFPQEAGNIGRLFLEISRFYKEFKRFGALALPFWLKFLLTPLFFPRIIKASSVTADKFISKYTRDMKLKALITNLWGFMGLAPSELSAFYFLVVFASYYFQPTDYIRGGFMRLCEAMVKKIEEKGGQIKFNACVSGIITDRGRAVKGVVTDKGQEFRAKAVISNANAIDTLCNFIDDDDTKAFYKKKLSGMDKSISAFQVYLGLRVPARELGMDHFMFFLSATYDQDDNYDYSVKGDYDKCVLSIVDHSQLDPSFAPGGKGTLMIFALDNYANWAGLAQDEYEKKKSQAAAKLISRVEKHLPGLLGHIEVMEAATPGTMERYGSSPQGAIYGFAQTLAQSSIMRLPQKTKVRGLFLAGGWTRPGGGVHACFVSGIDAADLALKVLR